MTVVPMGSSGAAARRGVPHPVLRSITACLIGTVVVAAGCGGPAEDNAPEEFGRRCFAVPPEVIAEIDRSLHDGEVVFAQAVSGTDPDRYVIAAEVAEAGGTGSVVVATWTAPLLDRKNIRLTALSDEAQRLSTAPAATDEMQRLEADRDAVTNAQECLRTAIRPEPTSPG